ncbi:hypothetical protein AN958_01833 [Leucoagaricus sp. SymC.cos]|nr:hypothetical protein AN958_01833 [Leucoagaricus sp. SymC.cos]
MLFVQLGNLTGSTNLQQSGKEQHAKGEAEYKQAQTQGYAQGTKDRVGGLKDSMVGAVKGDESKQAEGNLRRDKGETQQDINQ